MSQFEGPTGPKDVGTVLTRAFDTTNDALKTVLSGAAEGNQVVTLTERARLATITVGSVAKGADTDFVITQDEDGNPIPNTIYIHQTVIVPSAATIFRVMLFGKSTRVLADPLWFDYPFGAFDESYANDATGYWYINRDSARPNRIFGNAAVDAIGASAAAFAIFILFVEGR